MPHTVALGVRVPPITVCVGGRETDTVVRGDGEGERLLGAERDTEGDEDAEPEGDVVALRVTHDAPPSARE